MNEEAEIFDLGQERTRRSLRLATGGNGPSGPRGGNWISGLANGCRFLCKEKASGGSELRDCIVTTDPTDVDAVLLAISVKGRDGVFEWHDPKIFSKNHILIRTMETINVDDKHLQQRPVERHEDAEIQPGVHETE